MLKNFVLLTTLLVGGHASAIQVFASSYDMFNGTTGSFSYFDDTYSGSGCRTCANAALTNGLGDLTDGVLATSNWNLTPAPWVGWFGSQTITFRFDQTTEVSSISFRFDDSNSSGVNPPLSVTVAGQTYNIADATGRAPFDFVVSNLTFSGTTLPITITPRSGSFMMLSEVSFQSPVPEPATSVTLMVGCLGLLGMARLRRRAVSTRLAV